MAGASLRETRRASLIDERTDEAHSRARQSGQTIRTHAAQRRLVGSRSPRRRLASRELEERGAVAGRERTRWHREGTTHEAADVHESERLRAGAVSETSVLVAQNRSARDRGRCCAAREALPAATGRERRRAQWAQEHRAANRKPRIRSAAHRNSSGRARAPGWRSRGLRTLAIRKTGARGNTRADAAIHGRRGRVAS